jgi:hypothetical protein
VKTMMQLFVAFTCTLLRKHQSDIWSDSDDSAAMKIFESSANSAGCAFVVRHVVRSLIYKINKSGPSTDP